MMYRKLTMFFVAILMIGMAACNKNNPEAVAKQFLNGFYHMEYEKARQVSTEQTIQLVNLMEQFAIQYPDSVKQNAKKKKIELVEVKEDGDNAVALYTISDEPGVQQKLKLVKQNGKWLVSHSKQDDIDDAEEEPMDEAEPEVAAPATDSVAA
jgi:hypothetical protein